nr:MAG TPA: hypothetical protein [Caudoviricetes sp.]
MAPLGVTWRYLALLGVAAVDGSRARAASSWA